MEITYVRTAKVEISDEILLMWDGFIKEDNYPEAVEHNLEIFLNEEVDPLEGEFTDNFDECYEAVINRIKELKKTAKN